MDSQELKASRKKIGRGRCEKDTLKEENAMLKEKVTMLRAIRTTHLSRPAPSGNSCPQAPSPRLIVSCAWMPLAHEARPENYTKVAQEILSYFQLVHKNQVFNSALIRPGFISC